MQTPIVNLKKIMNASGNYDLSDRPHDSYAQNEASLAGTIYLSLFIFTEQGRFSSG